jgi:hypothetical protein
MTSGAAQQFRRIAENVSALMSLKMSGWVLAPESISLFSSLSHSAI